MKLTAQQIEMINEALIAKGLIYDDIKLELIDHIATDIELENEQSNFEDAFFKVFSKWEKSLEKTSSFWLANLAPRIVIEKYSSLYKSLFKYSLLSVIVFSVLLTAITILNPEECVYNLLKLVFASVYSLSCLTIITSLFFIWKLKSKTIYGRFFQKNCSYLGFYFFIIYTFLNDHTHLYRHYHRASFFENFMDWFMPGFFFFVSVYLIMTAIVHFKIVKKYKLL